MHHGRGHFAAAVGIDEVLAVSEKFFSDVVLGLFVLQGVVLVEHGFFGLLCDLSLEFVLSIDWFSVCVDNWLIERERVFDLDRFFNDFLVGWLWVFGSGLLMAWHRFVLMLCGFHAFGWSLEDVEEHFHVSLFISRWLFLLPRLGRFDWRKGISYGQLGERELRELFLHLWHRRLGFCRV